ncbi:hypothetical protein FHR97_002806 [Halomonas stenophila]|uniref:Uncharacterized protein n=2 Tax=Halomonas stenophila TaxID=795312 RepID=A0A7W5HM62_9GAMM|nr:hypothetical protein [Halomonas stenophila]
MFRKTKDPHAVNTYCWPEKDKAYQNLRVVIDKYLLSISGSSGIREIGFEGHVGIESMRGMKVAINFEILDPFETPSYLREVWNDFPKRIEGVCQFREAINSFEYPNFDVTCFCEEGENILHSLSQLPQFLNTQEASVVFDIEVDFPGTMENEFWNKHWRSEALRVRNWRFICGTKEK